MFIRWGVPLYEKSHQGINPKNSWILPLLFKGLTSTSLIHAKFINIKLKLKIHSLSDHLIGNHTKKEVHHLPVMPNGAQF